ncbi:kanadaptin [Periplaneta americana]|uniref:kanadaptin n=1 Tax=Periplaneta americana TaxID=6978 RepID=UPI0037E70326
MEVAQEETEKESVLEEESAKFETKNESEVKDTPDFENPTSDIFKKPQLIIGPRRGKVIGKIRSLENKPQEEPAETEEKEIDVTDSNLTDSVETDASVVKTVEIKSCNTVSPAQKIKESSIPLPYKEPKWSGIPEEDYGFEVLKSGKILENIKLNSKSFYVFGRLSTCDIRMAHPTISRYHAVLQYRSQENENDGVGFYIYDLGSTHGTFLNKNRIKPNMYVRVQVGHILKLGLSTRLFVLQGPEKDMEEESELTVTQMKEKRKLELAARELEELEQQRIEEERKQREEEEGIDWGMGEDADEETDLTENPFAATQNEELYINDPKKTLRGWFEREGYDLEYDVEEKGFGQFLCRVELPIESTRGCNVMAEALVKGKKKESVVQCALEACRILDRYGLLRQATHESKKRKAKNWEAEDFYDSDEDTFLDRTGTVEKKRQQRMRAAGKKDPTEVVETYDSLLKKHSDLLLELQKLELQLQKAVVNVASSSTKDNENDEEDALDAFMMKLSAPAADRKQVTKIKSQIAALKQEEVRLRKLVNIARPANIPELQPPNKATVPVNSTATNKKALPLVGVRKKPSNRTKPNVSELSSDSSEIKVEPGHDAEEEEEDDDDEEDGISQERESREIKNEPDSTVPDQEVQTEPEDHPEVQGKAEVMQVENPEHLSEDKHKTKVIGPTLPPPSEILEPAHPDADDESKTEEKSSERKKNRNKRRLQQRNEKASRQKADYDPSDPDYSVWVPPEGQTGDGRTKLNEKYGY